MIPLLLEIQDSPSSVWNLNQELYDSETSIPICDAVSLSLPYTKRNAIRVGSYKELSS